MDIRIFIEPQQGATYEDQARAAVATETAGLDGFFRSDHYLAMGDHYRHDVGPTDTWVTLGAIARETSRIRIGSLLSAATFRFPGPLAVSVAQVDAMSKGRVEFGLGAAWFEQEHHAYAIDFPQSSGERLARLSEQLEIVTGMWSTPLGATYDFKGTYYQVIGSPALPKPYQPRLPIIVGGKGPKRTPALAARFADEFNLPFPTFDIAQSSFVALEQACEERGRDVMEIKRSVALATVIGTDGSECERRAAVIGRELDELRTDGLAGTPDEIAARLEMYAELGVSRVYLQLLDIEDLEQIALIGAELAPKIANL
jgi:F420-dependent oxidoreductase-like protein